MKINLERKRPRGKVIYQRLNDGKAEKISILVHPKLRKLLLLEAQKRKYSLSLYINLILMGQESLPMVHPNI